ncbi:competence/damage-inducible protein A [Parvibaculum sedimenti]|uniref:Competence/damage-inducible protein A n=1 Tax=Parvibaculum sedimenti TaxID=2608632 RepID=A0A6N6VED4_9HYPH|nr:competence/damage-inducible protein A [Parvibaculum sedimenti]KAB7739061.1 competence/damage-inducible protein A [Parvibaculum sedimenti]
MTDAAGRPGAESAAPRLVTACVVLIGDEILSGRTRDSNLSYIAQHLNQIGVQVREARVIPDVEETIVSVINEVRARHDYVFTTGGIGPTHDDITADSIAKAFGVPIDHHPEAMAILDAHYKETGGEFTEARKRMARIPEGATLIANPLSKAPGFQIGNVFVMAGVPMVMQVMLDSLTPRLEGGATMCSRTVSGQIGEGTIAEKLGELQKRFPDVVIGSYPYYRGKSFGTSLVMRGVDPVRLDEAAGEIRALLEGFGVEPIEGEPG